MTTLSFAHPLRPIHQQILLADSKTHPHSEIRTPFLHPIRLQAPPSPSGMLPSLLLGFLGKSSCPRLYSRQKELLKEAKQVFFALPPSPPSFSPLFSSSFFLSLTPLQLLQPRFSQTHRLVYYHGVFVHLLFPLQGGSSPKSSPS